MPPLLSADALEIFQKNIGFFIFIVLLLVLFAVIQNFDKLSEPFGTKRRWEVETARLAANLKHWELQKYKQEESTKKAGSPAFLMKPTSAFSFSVLAI